jgi:hypothetical protein
MAEVWPTTRGGISADRLLGVILAAGLSPGKMSSVRGRMHWRQSGALRQDGPCQLVTGSRANDRCGDRCPGEEPCQGDRPGFGVDVSAKSSYLDLLPMAGEALRRMTSSRQTPVFRFDHPAEQAALEP